MSILSKSGILNRKALLKQELLFNPSITLEKLYVMINDVKKKIRINMEKSDKNSLREHTVKEKKIFFKF